MGHTYTMRFHGMSLAIVIVANITYEEGKEKTKLLSWNFKTKCCKQFQYFHYSNKKTFLNRESSVASYVFTQARHFFLINDHTHRVHKKTRTFYKQNATSRASTTLYFVYVQTPAERWQKTIVLQFTRRPRYGRSNKVLCTA